MLSTGGVSNVDSLSVLMQPVDEWIAGLFAGVGAAHKFLFRVDAGRIPGLSFGHISRCKVLAEALRKAFSCESIFLMRDIPEGKMYATSHNMKVLLLSPDVDVRTENEIIVTTAAEFKPDWLVVDLPYANMDTSYFAKIREMGARILFIDDSRFLTPEADVILNSSILALDRTRINSETNTRYFLGPRYFIFDDSELRTEPDRIEGIFNIVMTFGGSDPADITLKAVRLLIRKKWNNVLFRVLLGPGYVGIEEIKELTKDNASFEVVACAPKLLPLLSGSDLTICAGGRTMYELAYMNKKFFPVASAEHEAEAVGEFLRRGFVRHALTSWSDEGFIQCILDAISEARGGTQ
jgi:spore coat polysaccharide biosynthesis predicted glycosyltransferase SpsG